jgi:hypothetical protein
LAFSDSERSDDRILEHDRLTSLQRAPLVSLEVPQPKGAEVYYSSRDLIDQGNRGRQDDLLIERKCVATIWSMRLNVTLVGIMIVDSIFLGLAARGAIAGLQCDLYEELVTEDVSINYDSVGLRRRASAGIDCHVTPT